MQRFTRGLKIRPINHPGKMNVMSCNFSTGRFLILCCISEMLTLLTTRASATAIGAEEKISVKPNPTRIAATIAIT